MSCYCSASHYSTDEHDSLRESSALHHSDSGADLSESSRDLDWEKYWAANGERLIWESWISKYGDYINPSYIQSYNEPGQGEETSFCIQPSEEDNGSVKKITFSGLLEDLNYLNEDLKSENTNNFNHFSDVQYSKPCVINNEENCDSELFQRRLSDISEGGKSGSGRSEMSSNCDDEERFRIGGASRCSGNSIPLTSTTDSMTNVTRMTISSSDSSYGADDSSARSLSLLSSTDSVSSTDQQWQQLWTEHFNEQYYTHYQAFIVDYNLRKHNIIEEGGIRSSENDIKKHEIATNISAINYECNNSKSYDQLSGNEDLEYEDHSNNVVLNCQQDNSRTEMFVDLDRSVDDTDPVPSEFSISESALQHSANVTKKSGKRKKNTRKFLYMNK